MQLISTNMLDRGGSDVCRFTIQDHSYIGEKYIDPCNLETIYLRMIMTNETKENTIQDEGSDGGDERVQSTVASSDGAGLQTDSEARVEDEDLDLDFIEVTYV